MAAPNPLTSLELAIAEARELPNPVEYDPPNDPLAVLMGRISSKPSLPAEPYPQVRAPTAAPDALESMLGVAVMNLVKSRPLSPESRAEAVRMTTIAIGNPTPENMQAILAALLRD